MRHQDGNTKQMIFKIAKTYIFQFMTLLLWDLSATGTLAGMGLGQQPVPLMLSSDQILGSERLGQQRQVVA